jgi:hypothetical protein
VIFEGARDLFDGRPPRPPLLLARDVTGIAIMAVWALAIVAWFYVLL